MSACPRRLRTSLPLAGSQILTVLSWLPEASRLPSGLKATLQTTSRWPFKVRSPSPGARSAARVNGPPPPETSRTAPVISRVGDTKRRLIGLATGFLLAGRTGRDAFPQHG